MARRPTWRRPRAFEVLANLVAIVVLPLVAGALDGWQDFARTLGLDRLADQLTGTPTATDIGWEVAGARALPAPGLSPYDELAKIAHLISMTPYDAGVHTHPPTSFVPWLVLAFVPYGTWIAAFTVASMCATAASMRVLDVPAWVAYPVAVLLALTPLGAFAMASTYPAMALLLALAWRYRDRPLVAGPAYALLAGGRGVAGVMLLYPVLRRQWRTVAIAVGVVVACLLVAIALQPDVVADYLTRGRDAIAFHTARPDLFTPQAILARRSVPAVAYWLVVATVAGVAVVRRREVFWVLAWVGLAITPLAWGQSAFLALPMLVLMWQSGRRGVVLVLAAVAVCVVAVAPVQPNAVWTVALVVTALGLVLCPIAQRRDTVAAVSPAAPDGPRGPS